jgi:hypothetical protein
MTKIPCGTAIARPFLPTQDFDLSKRFYEALGFEKLLDGEVAVFNVGGGGFLLQRFHQKEWAENTRMQLSVEDLDAWWAHVEALDLAGRFGVRPPRAPALQPWGCASRMCSIPAGCSGTSRSGREGAK